MARHSKSLDPTAELCLRTARWTAYTDRAPKGGAAGQLCVQRTQRIRWMHACKILAAPVAANTSGRVRWTDGLLHQML